MTGERKAVPLKWGDENGPIIGSAIIDDDGYVHAMITSKEHTDKITQGIVDYSIVDPKDITKKEEN